MTSPATIRTAVAPTVEKGTSMVSDVLVLCGLVLAILFAFRDALAEMVRLWNVSPMYSYGFTVPVISGYLLWTRRSTLQKLSPNPAWLPATAAFVVATGMSIAGRAGGIQVLDQLAFLLSLVGVVLLVFGVAYAKTAWAPIAYLLLMIPFWDAFTEPLHAPFQLRSATIGVEILQAIGIPVHRDGTIIALPGLTLEVARACSGVNYLVAVIALGAPLAYLYLPGIWRRAVLLISAVLVAALSNGLRVALIGALAYYDIGSPLHGPFHVLHGLFVAGIGYVALFAGIRVLAPRSERVAVVSQAGAIQARRAARQSPRPAGLWYAAAAAAVLFVLVGLNTFSQTPHAMELHNGFASFPSRLGAWTSVESHDTPAPTAWPGADTELWRRYRRSDGSTIDLYIGYFAVQRQSKELITYRATELHNRATRLQLTTQDGKARHSNYVSRGRDGFDTLFWYELGNVSETDRYAAKARTVWNTMWYGNNHGAVVVLQTKAPAGDSKGHTLVEFGALVADELSAQLRRVTRVAVRG